MGTNGFSRVLPLRSGGASSRYGVAAVAGIVAFGQTWDDPSLDRAQERLLQGRGRMAVRMMCVPDIGPMHMVGSIDRLDACTTAWTQWLASPAWAQARSETAADAWWALDEAVLWTTDVTLASAMRHSLAAAVCTAQMAELVTA